MFGREELDKLTAHKQVLLVESSLNRLVLQAECRKLRSATAWVGQAVRGPQELAPLLLLLAPLAGFLLVRGSRGSGSWLNRAAAALKWLGPLYGLWKRFLARRRPAAAENPPPA